MQSSCIKEKGDKLNNYDKDKFVILLCAGPTARKIKASEEYYTAGVNVTPKLIEKTNFWVINDACYLKDIFPEKRHHIENVVMPQFPHTVNGVNFRPSAENDYLSVTKGIVPKSVKVLPYNIQSARNFNLPYDQSFPFFEIKSSSEAAFRWLTFHGFRNFITLGHDPAGGYHTSQHSRPTRSGGHEAVKVPIDNDRYQEVHDRMRKVIHETNSKWIRVVLPPEQTFQEQVLKSVRDTVYNNTGYAEVVINL